MTSLTPINALVAFAAGSLSFASPCMLPLVPGYLAVIGADSDAATPRARIRGALLFTAGFGVVFVALGLGAGVFGGAVVQARRPIEIVGGIIIALLGVTLVSERALPAALQRRRGTQLRAPAPGAWGILGFGIVFGAAWSPCIGPTLGAILTLAAASGSAASGGVLLTVFALGLGVPFVLLAAGAGWFERAVGAARTRTRAIRLGSGVLLIAFGLLLALGLIGDLSARLSGVPGLDI